jgi:hypothetical protein
MQFLTTDGFYRRTDGTRDGLLHRNGFAFDGRTDGRDGRTHFNFIYFTRFYFI